MTFFSQHPKFGETSTVAANLDRLDFRYHHIIERNRKLLEGKRVLDIASHDGRFSFAALKGGGAKSVLGIEARDHLVENARQTFEAYNVAPSAYDFVVGDVFEEIGKLHPGTIDTALILGFLYHTARQYELFAALRDIGVQNVIVDCKVITTSKPFVLLRMEGTQADAQIWDAGRQQVLSSIPSAAALELIMEEFGFVPERLSPEGKIPQSASVYKRGRRVTIVGRSGM